MANTFDYAALHAPILFDKFAAELRSASLTTQGLSFSGANTIKIPYIEMSGFKNRDRNEGHFGKGSIKHGTQSLTMEHDRAVEFFADIEDLNETSLEAQAAALTSAFVESQAIHEIDAYRMSKIYGDYTANGGTADTTALTSANVLSTFDGYMTTMDDANVPQFGRVMFITPQVNNTIKQAANIERSLDVRGRGKKDVNRGVYSLDDVEIVVMPSPLMKTAYDFEDGYVPADGAGQINMILLHPRSIIAANKLDYIQLWAPGVSPVNPTSWLYQFRMYWDLFVVKARIDGVKINVTAGSGGANADSGGGDE